MEQGYIQMLEESLEKKVDILNQLQILCREQAVILQDDDASPDMLEENMDKKQALLDHIETLDKGFEEVFAKVSEELNNNKQLYAKNIAHMQELIKKITDKSVNIQALEQRNKELARDRFQGVKAKAKEIRQSNKAATTYYRNMMNLANVDPQFLDRKK
ncbi:MAG: flagellar protein FlgN [Lachnospiraceae bacterium]|nr:flagellar protein FlgN [Lachnospiraceae bacterium]